MLDNLVTFFIVILVGFTAVGLMLYAFQIFINQVQNLKGNPPIETWLKRLTLTGVAILGFFVLGWLAYFFLFGTRQYISELSNDTKSSNWPTTAGLITSSNIESWKESGDTYFEPKIEYKYEIDNLIYSSNRIRFGGFVPSFPSYSVEARETIRRYPSGIAVQVYFDPDNPSLSVLEPRTGQIRILLMLALWVSILISLCLFAGSCVLSTIHHLRRKNH